MNLPTDRRVGHPDRRVNDLRDGLRSADERSDWQDQIAKARYRRLWARMRAIALGLAAAALCVGIIGTGTLRAASRANKAADCANLLLGSVAAQQIDLRARRLGCDTTVAADLISRGQARDAAVQEAKRQADEATARLLTDTCSVLMLLPVPPADPGVMQLRQDLSCATHP